jgi:hypothetical protein
VGSSVAQTREAHAGTGLRGPRMTDLDRMVWPAFGAAASVAALIILWLGSGVGYSLDEIDTLIRTPGLDLDGALEPHNGHFIFTTRVAYWAILELFGTDYLPFRLLTVATVILTAALFLAYAGRRIGKPAALALSLLLLFFGSHPSHVMNGNGFTVLFAIACGLAALLLLERDDRGGDIGACALLCLGVATYTTGLPFVVGAGVAILLRDDRWRRIWIVAVPVAIYFAWWLQAEGQIGDPHDQVTVSNLLLLPAWGFQILSGVLGSVTGFDYFGDLASAGPALAVAVLGVLAWRLARGRLPDSFWIALAVLLTIWTLGAVTAGLFRLPDDSRYFFSTLVAALLVGVAAAAGTRWSRTSIIALYAAVAAALSTNLLMLRDGGDDLSALQLPVRAALGGVDAAGDIADPDLDIKAAAEGAPLGLPFQIPALPGETAVESYRRVAESYGPLGYSLEELRGRGEDERALTDAVLAGALEVGAVPAGQPGSRVTCLNAEAGQPTEFSPGSGVLVEAAEAPAEVRLRRFADTTTTEIASVAPAERIVVLTLADQIPEPWVLSTSAPATLCPLR